MRKALLKSLHERYRTVDDLLADLDERSGDELSRTHSLRPPPSRPGPSIAVLPFVDMSPEGDQEYFCDGMAEELIHLLTRVPGLRVASRTSAFQFKGKAPDLAAIRERLSVQTVLEGGVRKAGNRLRVTAQHVNVADGYQLWSERYDRELADVFAVKDEIAGSVVSATSESSSIVFLRRLRAVSPSHERSCMLNFIHIDRILMQRGESGPASFRR